MFKGEVIQSTHHMIHCSGNPHNNTQPNWASVIDLFLMGHFLAAPFLLVGDCSACLTM
jgi:hypothetical protein